MKAKKSPQADLERKRPLFFQIGIVVALSIILFAFEWGSTTKPFKLPDAESIKIDDIEEVKPIVKETKDIEQKKKTSTILKILPDAFEGMIDEPDFGNVEEGFNNLNWKDYAKNSSGDEQRVKEDEIFRIVEKEPQFRGGDAARLKYLANTLVYPQVAVDVGIQGRVYVSFIVEKDGSITDVQLLKGIGGGCDEETIEAVERMPKWEAGKQRNRAVRVRLQMAVNWVLTK